MPAKAATVCDSTGGRADPCVGAAFIQCWERNHVSLNCDTAIFISVCFTGEVYVIAITFSTHLLHHECCLIISPRAPLLYHFSTELVTSCHSPKKLTNSRLWDLADIFACLGSAFLKDRSPLSYWLMSTFAFVFTFLRQPSENMLKNEGHGKGQTSLCKIIWVTIISLNISCFISNLQYQLAAWRHKYFILLI